MNRLVLLAALVVCLADLASCGCFGWKKKNSKKDVDFSGVGGLLVKKLKDNNDIENNFALIKHHVAEMTDAETKATEILMQLKNTKSCNDDALRMLARAKRAGLAKMYGNGRGKAERRIGDMIWPDLEQLIELCIPYIDKQLDERASSVDGKLKEFLELTRPSYHSPYLGERMAYDMELAPANYIYIVGNNFKLPKNKHSGESQRIDEHQLVAYLDELAAREGHSADYFITFDWAGFTRIDKRKFQVAFKRHLVEPCKRFGAQFEPLFHGIHAIASLVNKLEYVRGRSVQFRQLAYTDKICQAVRILDENNNSQRRLGFNKSDMHKSLLDRLIELTPQSSPNVIRYYSPAIVA